MAGQYSEFISYLNKYGVAKTSHFELIVPRVLTGKNFDRFYFVNKVMAFRCETTEFPGRQILANDSKIYGPTYKTPYQSVYQEITLNFLETTDFLIRDFFEQWMSGIYNPKNNRLAYPDVYRYDIDLVQYDAAVDTTNNRLASLVPTATWRMFSSFPTAVNQMPVAWTEDGLHRVSVTMAYEWYTLETAVGAVSNDTKDKINDPTQPPRGSARP